MNIEDILKAHERGDFKDQKIGLSRRRYVLWDTQTSKFLRSVVYKGNLPKKRRFGDEVERKLLFWWNIFEKHPEFFKYKDPNKSIDEHRSLYGYEMLFLKFLFPASFS